jgi:hypothetical protein
VAKNTFYNQMTKEENVQGKQPPTIKTVPYPCMQKCGLTWPAVGVGISSPQIKSFLFAKAPSK